MTQQRNFIKVMIGPLLLIGCAMNGPKENEGSVGIRLLRDAYTTINTFQSANNRLPSEEELMTRLSAQSAAYSEMSGSGEVKFDIIPGEDRIYEVRFRVHKDGVKVDEGHTHGPILTNSEVNEIDAGPAKAL